MPLKPGYLPWLDRVSKNLHGFLILTRCRYWFTEGGRLTGEVFRPETNLDLHGTKFGLLPLYFTLSNDLELEAPLIWVTDVVVMEVSSLYPSHAKRICRLFE